MFEVPDVAVPDAPRECGRPHDPVAFERAADPRVGAKRSEVSGGEPGGGLEDIGWRFRYQIDRPPTALRPYKVPCGPRSTSMRSKSLSSADIS